MMWLILDDFKIPTKGVSGPQRPGFVAIRGTFGPISPLTEKTWKNREFGCQKNLKV